MNFKQKSHLYEVAFLFRFTIYLLENGDLMLGIFLPGIELFSQGATPQISSPLMRFTTEFEMGRSGSTSP